MGEKESKLEPWSLPETSFTNPPWGEVKGDCSSPEKMGEVRPMDESNPLWEYIKGNKKELDWAEERRNRGSLTYEKSLDEVKAFRKKLIKRPDGCLEDFLDTYVRYSWKEGSIA